MKNKFNWPLWHWHFEITSVCTLRCHRCARTEVPETLVQTQLRLDFFEKNFTFTDQIKKITFCGDDGDPIYARDLILVVNFFKTQNPDISIEIITNGSYRSAEWWAELGRALNNRDRIHFSLDGWDQESNEKYRVNCDWDTIKIGIDSLRSNTNALMQWDAIAFSFNQHQLEYMKNMAKSWGFDSFQLTKSSKFGSKYQHYLDHDDKDSLEPNQDLVAEGHRFSREIDNLTGRTLDNTDILNDNVQYYNRVKAENVDKKIVPLCMIGTKGMFVNSQGYFIPCCWIGNRYNHNGLENFLLSDNNIKLNGIEHVLNAPHWGNFIDNFENMMECNIKCVNNIVTKEYATSW